MKKVLICLTNFYPKVGGVERYVEELFSRLVQKGYEVHIVTMDNYAPRYENFKGMHIYRIKSILSIGNVFCIPHPKDWQKFVSTVADKNKYNFISTQTRFFYSSYLGVRLSKKYNIPVIHTEHGSGFVYHSSLLVRIGSRIFDYTLGKYVLKNAQGVTAVSKKVKNFIFTLAKRSDVKIIYNGIDSSFWNPDKVKIKSIEEKSQNHIKVFYMSRLLESKGWRILLEAVRGLTEKEKQGIKILIAGDGPDKSALIDCIDEYNLGKTVQYLGKLTSLEIREILNNSYYCNPSFSSEGLQTTLLEAAAMNSWIITTDVSGVEEVVVSDNMGMVIEQRDSNALRNSLQYLIREKPKADSRNFIVENFSWEIIVKQYDNFISDLFL